MKNKVNQLNTLMKTIKCNVPANIDKIEKLNQLLKPSQYLLNQLIIKIDKEFLLTGNLNKFCKYKTKDLNTDLPAVYVQTLYTQALESYKSYLAILQIKFNNLVYNSSLDNFTKTTLIRINKYQLWYKKDISLYWNKFNDEYIPCRKNYKNSKYIKVNDYILYLARHIIKKIKHRWTHRPNFKKVRTLKLDNKCAKLQNNNHAINFNYWVQITTLMFRKPAIVPLLNNKYLFNQIKRGKLLKFIQLTFNDDKSITISPIVEQKTVTLRTKGKNIGIDWGMKKLFTTSDGHIYGVKMLRRLRCLDKYVTEYAADLQKQNISLKNDAKYQKLQSKIKNYVKNEVGRILNKISLQDIKEISVEELNFSGGGLSRKLNRLITRCGRHALKIKLQRLQEEKGIVINEVNAAYTSQQCERCYFTDRKNRKSQKQFKCIKCGFKLNADVNAARNIRDRRSVLNKLSSKNYATPRTRKAICDYLSILHELNSNIYENKIDNNNKIVRNIGLTTK